MLFFLYGAGAHEDNTEVDGGRRRSGIGDSGTPMGALHKLNMFRRKFVEGRVSISTSVSPPVNAPGSEHGGFIPSLEGMRALAVILTVLFHLGVEGAGGGYLGIDLFFVISGVIITRNSLFDRQTGTFSLHRFSVRR